MSNILKFPDLIKVKKVEFPTFDSVLGKSGLKKLVSEKCDFLYNLAKAKEKIRLELNNKMLEEFPDLDDAWLLMEQLINQYEREVRYYKKEVEYYKLITGV